MSCSKTLQVSDWCNWRMWPVSKVPPYYHQCRALFLEIKLKYLNGKSWIWKKNV